MGLYPQYYLYIFRQVKDSLSTFSTDRFHDKLSNKALIIKTSKAAKATTIYKEHLKGPRWYNFSLPCSFPS